MSIFDLTILFQNLNGDRDFEQFNNKINNIRKNEKYPPYNIKIEKDNLYIIELALAGFKEDELFVSLKNNYLTVKSLKVNDNCKKYYLYKGIANRNFEKTFKLNKNIEIDKCYLNKGILYIPLQIQKSNKTNIKNVKIEKY